MSTGGSLKRRDVLALLAGGAAAAAWPRLAPAAEPGAIARRPNVVLILTDDQGYGDLSCHGNDKLKTPHVDRLAAEGIELTHFHVSPVCAPTRASLMTGRWNYRTRAIDTYLGRAMMDPEEVTLARMLADAGYRTGIFGKWHLGDNYPLRAMDHGFQESLVFNGGGLRQPSWPPNNPYFDPVLFRNGKEEKQSGYCMDVYTDAAMQFIEANRDRPFFAYLATNLPHEPLEVPEKYAASYTGAGLDEKTAKVYGMIANIDENVGRLLAKLKDLGLERDTIVIFMTDNGAFGKRFSAGLRAGKGTVYDGGIRVPFFIRWPARLAAGRKLDRIAAHVDVVPTLLDACGAAAPEKVKLDGLDLLPLLDGRAGDWPERTLYFQWHRGDAPELYRDAAARADRHKLVMRLQAGKPAVELYDMTADPGESKNIAAEQPDVVRKMREGYEAWFKDVSATRGYDPPRIVLGAPQQDPSILSRQDWRGPRAGWARDSLGHWEVEVARAGSYAVTLRFAPAPAERVAHFKLNGADLSQELARGADLCVFEKATLAQGKGRLEAWLDAVGATVGVQYVETKFLG